MLAPLALALELLSLRLYSAVGSIESYAEFTDTGHWDNIVIGVTIIGTVRGSNLKKLYVMFYFKFFGYSKD